MARTYGRLAACERAMLPRARTAVADCLKKQSPGSIAWHACIQSHVDAAAKSGTKPSPPAPQSPTIASQIGTIGALTDTSITVGPLTCRIAAASPDVSGFAVGERAGIQCADDVLTHIARPPG